MHDLHAADQILKLVLAQANDHGLLRVKSIVVELGSMIEHGEEINPDNLTFNLKLLAKNTPAEAMAVTINKVQGGNWKLVEIEGDNN
ncbi:MAG: hydrogenase/urease maturation nickel metallochaperone HypA [Patescibacteria group bacterium]|jgi:Zn finger protein HypA/HybF involved in hydrogenase expression|nr:hydrogenase/urease maturation nickel metallochaperone HypA [Patescibacteria group bacterium]